MSARYYYSVDEQGSTDFITDKYGNVKNEYWYDAFGNVLNSKQEVHNRITYTGQQFDNISQQYYLRARFYNPVIGRFTQEDVYRGDGLNLYAYCGNNPVVYWDPSGYARNCKSKTQTSKRPGGYKVNDVDEHGKLSPGINRAKGNHNTKNEGRVQSHHIIQDKWAKKNNIKGYRRDKAPAILLKTGVGESHTSITNSQRQRRRKHGYNTTIREEFNASYKDLIDAKVNRKAAKKAIGKAYKYYDSLGAFK